MRTDPRADDPDASTSRRAFLVGAGATAVPFATGGAAGGEAGDAASPGAVTVEATAPYAPAARAVAEAFERRSGDGRVRLRRLDAGSPATLGDGPADVRVSGRPPSSGGPDPEADRHAVGHGWAALATRSEDWHSVLRPSALRARVEADSPVETWHEADWDAVSALEDAAGDDVASACAGVTGPADDHAAVVRGTRAYQYARGRGGEAFYEVPAASVGAPSAARERGDALVPLVRVAYVSADSGAAPGGPAEEFLAFYRERAPTDLGNGAAATVGDRRAASTA